ncbi:NAD-dependent epimerase/dehydratase family protein [Mycobacterium sp. M1]|uniref:NAD-dependent epimerase/dehydratase family protein n=1 Tax=Mycolicibacter acidiphilus TaxID=2835306 RepID=A0ABS5RF39_9MYCO|nr:NAD-dependent epimerase/dehydratase family protein [Mycolicibacter acidiphilus]MBS9532900.1 NAD-dependent epimerase/dehydratase family protein [Mycolicibacter acidiphilus]
MAHAAITGASGLLGANLTAELIAAGHTVTAIRRASTDTSGLSDLPVTWVDAGLGSTAELRAAFAGADVVFHCAAAVSTRRRVTPAIRATNVDGTQNVIDAVIDCGTPRLVHTSTANTIGPNPDSTPCDEDSPWAMDRFKFANAYAVTKHQAEILVDRAADAVDAVIVHPTYLIGPRDSKPSSGRMILEVVRRRTPFWLPGYNNFADVREVARGMIAAWSQGKRGEHYLLGGAELTYRDFMERVARLAGVRPPSLRLPHPLARIAGRFGDLAEAVTGRETTVNSFAIRYAFTDLYRYRSDKAVRELGYRVGPIEPAIDAALTWFRERGMLD